MIKSSFTVGYRKGDKKIYVLGVTSIVPNMNGLLFFTEDGKNHVIESYEMKLVSFKKLAIQYSDEEDIALIYKKAEREPDKYEVFDRTKN